MAGILLAAAVVWWLSSRSLVAELSPDPSARVRYRLPCFRLGDFPRFQISPKRSRQDRRVCRRVRPHCWVHAGELLNPLKACGAWVTTRAPRLFRSNSQWPSNHLHAYRQFCHRPRAERSSCWLGIFHPFLTISASLILSASMRTQFSFSSEFVDSLAAAAPSEARSGPGTGSLQSPEGGIAC